VNHLPVMLLVAAHSRLQRRLPPGALQFMRCWPAPPLRLLMTRRLVLQLVWLLPLLLLGQCTVLMPLGCI
jgi:hypothetical protein